MEEDIMIVKELLQGAKDNGMYDNNKYFNSIENLIKEYRELEENIHKEHTLGYSQGVYDCSKAWKEKIQEEIEPVIDSLEKDGFVGYADELRDIVSELMEEK